jgi:hypothetical protein
MTAAMTAQILLSWLKLIALDDDLATAEPKTLRQPATPVNDQGEALKRLRSDSGEGRAFTREELAEAWGISKADT